MKIFQKITPLGIPLITISLIFLFPVISFGQVKYEKDLEVKNYDIGFLISWSTFSEQDNESFTIERSFDGNIFQVIGNVQSKLGSNEINEYQFVDNEIGLKKVYYRLIQRSKDGTKNYSKIVSKEKDVMIYFQVMEKEKLTENLFRISVKSIKEGEIKCRLSTNLGEIISDEIRPLTIGLNDYAFDLSNEPDGTYHLILKNGRNQNAIVLQKKTKKKNNVASKTSSEKF